MKANLRAVLIILAITYVVSFVTSPADQISFVIEWLVSAAIGLGSYVAGFSKGQSQAVQSA